jgi:putative toxin-antitoxin system antitoxin component (TIGR02293 family)
MLMKNDPAALIDRMKAGFPFSKLARFQKATGFTADQIGEWVGISRRTMARRREEGRLNSEESDRLLRAERLYEKVLALFDGEISAARQWMSMSQRTFSGRTPLEFATTDIGTREVERLVGRLEHGVFS